MTENTDQARAERFAAAMRGFDPASVKLVREAQQDGATLAVVPDELLVGMARYSVSREQAADEYVTEMNRRLKDATEHLTVETITARESSERQSGQLDASIGALTAETVRSRESAERLTRWLIGFTAGLLVLTAVLVWLTVILARRG